MIIGNGVGFDYLVDVLVNLDLDVVEFLCKFQYGLYMIIFTRYCLLKFVLLDSFYHEKVAMVTLHLYVRIALCKSECLIPLFTCLRVLLA